MIFPLGSPFIRIEYDTVLTHHREGDPSFLEAHFSHNCLNICPFYSIIRLAHVEFHSHPTLLSFPFLIYSMHDFKSYKHIVGDLPSEDECTLLFTNHLREDFL